jgi:hypothetical protein
MFTMFTMFVFDPPLCINNIPSPTHPPTVISDLAVMMQTCVEFLTLFLEESDAERRAAGELVGIVTDPEFQAVMDKLTREFCPAVPRPMSAASRQGRKVSVCHACAVCTPCACVLLRAHML